MMRGACNALAVRGRTSLLGILLLAAVAALGAQETSLEEIPGLRERAVIMRIISRIVEQNQEVVWDSENARVTIPGRPVGLRLVGANLVVAVQFTPFLRPNGQHILVAQGQIWMNVPDEGISYRTTMQTIPVQFSEEVYFFPLGSKDMENEAHIEIQLVLEPYSRSQGDGRSDGRQSPERRSPRQPSAPSAEHPQSMDNTGDAENTASP